MLYRLLGPLDVLREGEALDLGSPKQRAVLAVLLLAHGRVVSTDRLVDAVWGEHAPPSALGSLQVYVSNLRRVLRDGRGAAWPILRRAPGYVLDVPAEDVDAAAFLTEAEAARHAVETEDWDGALTAATGALARWRGPLLADLSEDPWVRAEADTLAERRAGVRETLVTALLGCDRVAEAVAEAARLRSEHPLREDAVRLHLVALHRAGRSTEALEIYRRHTAELADELGLDPGARLRDVQQAILRQDPALATWPRTGTPDVTPAPAVAATGETAAHDALVGRARETEQIERLLADVRAGATRWLVLSGPPGIGKTRLADEAARRFRAAGGTDAWARCPEEEGAPAWWPLRQVVRSLGGDPDDVLVPPAGVDADAARFAVYERVQEFLMSSAARGPRLVVVDDVQWADPTSTRCLSSLVGALQNAPLAVVLTMRDGEAGPDVRRMVEAVARAGHRRITVPPLAAADVTALATQIAGEPVDASEAFLLAERTGGNPLFVSEYARLPRQERLGDGIPTAVRAVLGRRLAGLDAGVLQVLRTAAVIGDVLDVELLSAVARIGLDDLADSLDEAADQRIIVPAAGTAGYAFAHGLLREEVLAGLSDLRRRRLHARVAEAIGPGGDSDHLARRAQHLMAALPLVDAGQALDACRAAAADAQERWNSESAAQWWAASLVAFDLLGPDARPAHERDDLLVAQVTALAHAGRGETVLALVEAGLLDAVRAGRTATAGRLAATLLRGTGAWPWASYGGNSRALLDRLAGLEPFVAADPAAHARVLAALAVGSYYDPDPAVPESLSGRALAIAEALGDPDVLADALLGRALTYSGVASRVPEQLAVLERLGGLSHAQARTDDVLRHCLTTLALLPLGDLDGVMEHLRLGTAGSDVLRLPTTRTQFRWMESNLAMYRGDLAESERLRAVAADLHEQTELYVRGAHDLSLCILRWHQGRLPEIGLVDLGVVEPTEWEAAIAAASGDRGRAERLVAQQLAACRPEIWTTLGHLAVLAEVVADLGLLEHASLLLERLLPDAGHIANVGQIGVIGPVGLPVARLLVLLGRDDEALAHLAAVRDVARRTGSASALLRCRLIEAQMRPASPERTAVLAEVADAAARLGMAGVARAARSALEPA